MKLLKSIFTITVLVILTQPLKAVEQTLTIKNFISFAEKNDPNLKSILKDKEKLTFIVDQNLPSRKALLEVHGEKGFGSDSDSDSSSLSGTLSKEIIESGTKLSISHSKTTQPDKNEDVTELRLEQDLYKNIFGRDVRLKKSALKDEEAIIRLQFLEQYENYLNTILLEYLDFQKAYLGQELAKAAYKDAQRLHKNVKQKYQKKIASQTDLDKSSLQVIIRKEEVLLKNRELEQQRQNISRITGSLTINKPSQKLFHKIYNYYKDQIVDPSQNKDYRTIKIINLKSGIAQKDLTLAGRENNASLSLVAGYDIDNSERYSSTVNRHESIVGLRLSLPLGDSQKKADEKSAHFTLSKTKIDLNIEEQKLNSEAKLLLLKITEMQQRQNLTKNKLKMSKRIVRAEKKRYQYGRISLDTLIELESNYVSYQLQHQSEELEFGKTLLQWLALNDKLLEFKNKL